MKFLKIIPLVMAICLAVLFGFAATQPETFTVESSIEIPATPDVVYPWITELQRWESWSPWKKNDPSVVYTYTGPTSGTGATLAWASKKSGAGTITLTEAIQNEKIAYRLKFMDWNTENEGALKLEAIPRGTKVTWVMEGKNTLILKVMFIVFRMKDGISNDFEMGLKLMKDAVLKG